MASKKAVAKKDNQELMNVQDNMPAYLQNQEQTGRGSEDVETGDMVIPRLEIVQSLSPARDKKDEAAYIEGAEEGMLYNNVTRELYGNAVTIVPVLFKKEFLIWKDRKAGGGFRGAFPTEQEALATIKELEDGDDCEAVDTAQHFCLLLNHNTGKVEEIAISMSRSKMKVNRTFNSLIRINGGDRFSRAYKISAVQEANNDGDKYFNFAIHNLGFPPEAVYRQAETLYEAISAGGRVIDRSQDDDKSAESKEF